MLVLGEEGLGGLQSTWERGWKGGSRCKDRAGKTSPSERREAQGQFCALPSCTQRSRFAGTSAELKPRQSIPAGEGGSCAGVNGPGCRRVLPCVPGTRVTPVRLFHPARGEIKGHGGWQRWLSSLDRALLIGY